MEPVHPLAVNVIPATRETVVVNTVSIYSVIPVIYLSKLVYIYIKMWLRDADDLDLYFQTICTPRSMSTWCLLPR